MAQSLLCLVAVCSVHAAPSHVGRSNIRPVAHLDLSIANDSIFYHNEECGVAVEVSHDTPMDEKCPASCPLYVEDKTNFLKFDFACVYAAVLECKAKNPATPVPDLEFGECRRCEVVGCDECLNDGMEHCAKCLTGYVVNSRGHCVLTGAWLLGYRFLYFSLLLLLVVAGFVVCWVVDLSLREEINPIVLASALHQRSRAKIHQPLEDGEAERAQRLWPLNTNLCVQDVAGPAVKLLFNFQVAIIVWATVLALAWYFLGKFTDARLLELGTRGADTARQDSINVKWGHHTMQSLTWAKIGFLEFAYLFSFVGAILFGIRQRHMHEQHGVVLSTHQDYAVLLRGLPEIQGTEKVEEELKAAVMKATNQSVVGVSVGWQLKDGSKALLEACMDFRLQELSSQFIPRHHSLMTPAEEELPVEKEMTLAEEKLMTLREWLAHRLDRVFFQIEKVFVHPSTQSALSRGRRKAGMKQKGKKGQESEDESAMTTNPDEVQAALHGLKTSSSAFVVFETQEARDKAAQIWKKVPMEFAGTALHVEVPDFEPETVLWPNLSGNYTTLWQIERFLAMLVFVAMMIGLLCVFEYMYYHIQLNNVFATGQETMSVSFILTTACVAGMMAVLCALSAEVADRCAFEYVGSRETCFVLLYTFSVVVQLFLDLVIAYFIGKHLMDVNEIYTHDGKKIADMNIYDDFADIFETYAMQKQLGVTVLSFGFPCAFLLPFLAEPLVSIFLPYKIMSLIIVSHADLNKEAAASYLEAVPMDLGRYGDIMINVIVGSLILWFPGGFTFTIFIFLACSHLYIYWYDHYRLLRCVQSIYLTSFNADLVAQLLFAVPCSIIAAALVFKSNCQTESSIAAYVFPTTHLQNLGLWGSSCDHGHNLVLKVLLAFACHLALHTIMLIYCVPWITSTLQSAHNAALKEEIARTPYEKTASRYPQSWFSANLIHCLRSEYVYQHDPPFDFCVRGREHLMRYNPSIGAWFVEDNPCEMEDYRLPVKNIRTQLSRTLSFLTSHETNLRKSE